jgi:hypothetical protein
MGICSIYGIWMSRQTGEGTAVEYQHILATNVEELTGEGGEDNRNQVMLGEVIGKIAGALVSVDKELVFGNKVLDLVEVDVNGFESTLSDRGTGLIGLDGSFWLLISPFVKSVAEPGSIVVNAGHDAGMLHAGI